MKRILLGAVALYQKTISPDHGVIGQALLGGACRFDPTCSQYFYQAVEKHGAVRGSALGFGRVLRCHPFSKGGFDPVR